MTVQGDVTQLPEELRQSMRWICWRAEQTATGETTKIPYQAAKLEKANVRDPAHYNSFMSSNIALGHYGHTGLGFVFRGGDNNVGIDLDNPYSKKPDGSFKYKDPDKVAALQLEVVKRTSSYAEVSPSGSGLHILCRGEVIRGRRANGIEVYGDGRFFTMTGAVYRKQQEALIDEQETIDWLLDQMGDDPLVKQGNFGSLNDPGDDERVLTMAAQASNGEKFLALYAGNWEAYYPSRSEADFALVDIIGFYTESRPQVERLFRQSPLWVTRQGTKYERYIEHMITRAFDKHTTINFDALIASGNDKFTAVSPISVPALAAPDVVEHAEYIEPSTPPYYQPLPGLMGEIARYVYGATNSPMVETAVTSAIGIMAGVTGRAFQVSKSGLNYYVLCLAPTGSGKEAISRGTSAIFNAVAKAYPSAKQFIGPKQIPSGQGLHKALVKQACFVTIRTEVDSMLAGLKNTEKNPTAHIFKGMLLDLWSKSAKDSNLGAASYSDSTKNVEDIERPAFSMMGEATPAGLYAVLDEAMIKSGLLPRFSVLEYMGSVPDYVDDPQTDVPEYLVKLMTGLVHRCHELNQRDEVETISFTSEAAELFKSFRVLADHERSNRLNEIANQLWSRAHLKAMRLAGMIAVGCNLIMPTIDTVAAKWAINFVEWETRRLQARFARGDFGSGEIKQTADIMRRLRRFMSTPPARALFTTSQKAIDARVIPDRWLKQIAANYASFTEGQGGYKSQLERWIKSEIDSGVLVQLTRTQIEELEINGTQRWFALVDFDVLDQFEGAD